MKVVECDFLTKGYTLKLGDILIVGTKTAGVNIHNEKPNLQTG